HAFNPRRAPSSPADQLLVNAPTRSAPLLVIFAAEPLTRAKLQSLAKHDLARARDANQAPVLGTVVPLLDRAAKARGGAAGNQRASHCQRRKTRGSGENSHDRAPIAVVVRVGGGTSTVDPT